MRAVRRALPDAPERSERIWSAVCALEAITTARVVMAFDSIPGEPLTAPFVEWCVANGKQVVMPEDDPVPDPAAVDVVVVPGIAFTRSGDRLGQGGGWYDRFLTRVRDDCVLIGVCFDPLVVERLPVEDHDVRIHHVVTERGLRSEV